MAARGLLSNPALFAGHARTPWDAVGRFVELAATAPMPFPLVRHHLAEMTAGLVGEVGLVGREERRGLLEMGSMLDCVDWVERVGGRVGGGVCVERG